MTKLQPASPNAAAGPPSARARSRSPLLSACSRASARLARPKSPGETVAPCHDLIALRSGLVTTLFVERGTEQVLPAEEWQEGIEREKVDRDCLTNDERLQRAYRDYLNYSKRLEQAIKNNDVEAGKDVLERLIQIQPHTVYGYDQPSRIGQEHLKGKGREGQEA